MKLDVCAYKFPFIIPFATAAGTFGSRKGLYLRFKKDGITAWGEAAPLPRFSKETISDVIHQLQDRRAVMNDLFEGSFSLGTVRSYLNSARLFPSLEFAIYTLTATWLAQKQGQSLHGFLFDTPRNTIPINAVLGWEEQDPIQTVDKYVEQGFETVKIKADHQTGKLVSSLQKIRKKYPELFIRIDANQSWSAKEAADCLKRIEDYSIEYCEEPLVKPNAAELKKLGTSTTVPIALDESLTDKFSLREAAEIVSVLILKPAILGARAFSNNVSELIKSRSKKIIFTTALESGIGRLMTASLAAGHAPSDFAHGLGTGDLLKRDIWNDDLFISNGNFHLPDAHQLAALMNQIVTDLPLVKIS